jgi:hypothetical protein
MAIGHNSYFDGHVQSLGFDQGGAKATVGVMAVGDYHFGTEAPERMSVVAGELRVRLDGADEWNTYPSGTSFDVPGNSGFDLEVPIDTAYLCEYL